MIIFYKKQQHNLTNCKKCCTFTIKNYIFLHSKEKFATFAPKTEYNHTYESQV